MKLKQSRAMHTVNSRCITRERNPMTLPDIKMEDRIRDLLLACVDQGWRVELTSDGTKVMCFPKDKTKHPIPVSGRTYGRGLKNIETALKRAGLELPGSGKTHTPNVEVIELDADAPLPQAGPNELLLDFRGKSPAQALEQVNSLIKADITNDVSEILSKMVGAQRDATMTATTALAKLMGQILTMFDEVTKTDDKLETQVLESMEQVDRLEKQLEKVHADLSRVGAELQSERQARVAAEERAVKAENNLSTIKKALA